MADFSNLFSLMGAQAPVEPEVAPTDNLAGIRELLMQQKDKLEKEYSDRTTDENSIYERLGLTPEVRTKQKMDADKPKGFWKNLGKYASEIVAGATQGENYVPYSERMRMQAMQDYAAETPGLREQLQGVTSQKNHIMDNQQKLVALAKSLGVDLTKADIAQQNATTRKAAVDQKAPLTAAQVEATNALTGLRGSQTALTDAKTEGQGISNVNATNTQGLNGRAALDLLRATNPALNEALSKIIGADAKAKADAKPKAAGKAASKHTQLTTYIDPATSLPYVLNKDTNQLEPTTVANSQQAQIRPTGQSKDSISRSVSGYAQTEKMNPLIDKLVAKGKMGKFADAFQKYMNGKGFGDDPEFKDLMMQADSVAKFSAGIHNTRSAEAMKDLYDKIFSVASSPEAMKAGLRATKRAFADRARSLGATPKDWGSVFIDPASVEAFLQEDNGTTPPGVAASLGLPTAPKVAVQGITMEDIQKEKARRDALKKTGKK